MFSWSGSAALGGLLVGYKGIIFNFCVTAFVQFVATLPLVLLFSREGMEGDHVVNTTNGALKRRPSGSNFSGVGSVNSASDDDDDDDEEALLHHGDSDSRASRKLPTAGG